MRVYEFKRPVGQQRKVAIALLSILLLVLYPKVGWVQNPGRAKPKPLSEQPSGPRAQTAELHFFIGDVTIKRSGTTKWEKVTKIGVPLKVKDVLKTGKESRAEVYFPDQSIIRIDQNTTYQLESLKGKQGTESKLQKGKLWGNIKKLTASESFEVASPTAVAAIRGTIWRMDYTETKGDTTTDVKVYEGQVQLRAPWWRKPEQKWEEPEEIPEEEVVKEVTLSEWTEIITLQANQWAVIKVEKGKLKAGKGGFSLTDEAKDPWVQWNRERDRLIER